MSEEIKIVAETTDPVCDLMNRAADIIAEKGLTKGKFRDPATGACCAVGAIRQAGGGSVNSATTYVSVPAAPYTRLCETAVARLHEQISKNFGDFDDVPDWNDAPERTAEEVIAALRGC